MVFTTRHITKGQEIHAPQNRLQPSATMQCTDGWTVVTQLENPAKSTASTVFHQILQIQLSIRYKGK